MKRWKLVEILVNYIYHDNIYLISPILDWEMASILNKYLKDSYQKVRPILLKWQEKGYITLVEDDDVIFVFHPEKLPSKEQLINESKIG